MTEKGFRFDYVFSIEVAPAKTAGAFIIAEQLTHAEAVKAHDEFKSEIDRVAAVKHENIAAILLRYKKITIAEMVDYCRFRHCYIFPFPTRTL